MSKKKGAYLFGPFIGELSWEFYRFAPYVIYLKKMNPYIEMVVLTRPERFDLYGCYADILVPLRIPNDIELKQEGFKSRSLLVEKYKEIQKLFKKSYNKKFSIDYYFVPDIEGFRYKLKWQFPRYNMDYDFRPRRKNIEIVESLNLDFANLIFVDLSWIEDQNFKKEIINKISFSNFIEYSDFRDKIEDKINYKDSSILGCLIHLIKKSNIVVGNMSSPLTHLSILLKKKILSINENIDEDSINLLNPFKMSIIKCDSDNISSDVLSYSTYLW